jgi:hypothetical protein
MVWELSEPITGLKVEIDEKGLWVRGPGNDVIDYARQKQTEANGRLGRLLPFLLPQLVELQVAEVIEPDIFIPFPEFVSFEGTEIDAFDDLVPWSPFALELESKGSSIGSADFGYNVRFFSGMRQVHVERMGCFLKRGERIFRLERQLFTLLEAIDSFNSMAPSEKVKINVLPKFAMIKGLAQDIGAQIDQYILKEKVIVPAKIDLDLIEEKDGRISFVPRIDRVPTEDLFRVFMASDDIDEYFAIDDNEGGRIRVLLDDDQREVLRRMQRVRHLSGADKAKVLRNPYEVFDGVASSVDIDLTRFGPRVTGIGDFPFVSVPFIKYEGTGIFDDDEGGTPLPPSKFNAGIDCSYVDGTKEKVYFDSKKNLLEFCHQAKVAWQNGKGTVDLKGKTIVVDKDFIDGLESLSRKVTRTAGDDRKEQVRDQAYLLIYTNENELEYREDEQLKEVDEVCFSLPHALARPSDLKQYQIEGVKWMQLNYLLHEHSGRRGCLLADEMGLGKTLQVLTFLAWLIERGGISPADSENHERYPWNPILIIAPLMLLENESWPGDMSKFFKNDGSVFEPYLVLHGNVLRKMRRPEMIGRETDLRTSVLNLDELRRYRVILTSYETVINYQFSFAMMKDAWSVVVTDEAQAYKTPNSKISHALKSLAPRIRIACTGTPVETKLMDVWNILDYLQPGVLGSAAEFAHIYEQPIVTEPERRDEVLGELKTRLFFGKRHAYVLRREKKDILNDLPAKHEHKEYCDLTPHQRDTHVDFVNQARDGSHAFAILSQLMKLYEHPDLLPTYRGITESQVDEALERSPKLERVVRILDNVRRSKEKILIFTRSLNMQQLLATVISAKFGLNVDIVNGVMSRAGYSHNGARTRKECIRRFCESAGFNVLIVSPDVAGVGITVVEANHVIHYSRWWNPAKEMQATDRVYRIGQQKDVHVYYPISRDPENLIRSFDERLDRLLDRRKELARDFLAPMPIDEESQRELIGDLTEEATVPGKTLSEEDVAGLPWHRFEALVALLEQKKQRRVILTPRSGDLGVDVISIGQNEVFLLQCKHTNWGSSCDADVVDEVISAFDNYRGRCLKGIRNVALHPVIVTNGKLTKTAKRFAKERDVRCVDYSGFMEEVTKKPCSMAEIEIMENQRKASMKDVELEIRKMLS